MASEPQRGSREAYDYAEGVYFPTFEHVYLDIIVLYPSNTISTV